MAQGSLIKGNFTFAHADQMGSVDPHSDGQRDVNREMV